MYVRSFVVECELYIGIAKVTILKYKHAGPFDNYTNTLHFFVQLKEKW
jgi:hypothetical protein